METKTGRACAVRARAPRAPRAPKSSPRNKFSSWHNRSVSVQCARSCGLSPYPSCPMVGSAARSDSSLCVADPSWWRVVNSGETVVGTCFWYHSLRGARGTAATAGDARGRATHTHTHTQTHKRDHRGGLLTHGSLAQMHGRGRRGPALTRDGTSRRTVRDTPCQCRCRLVLAEGVRGSDPTSLAEMRKRRKGNESGGGG